VYAQLTLDVGAERVAATARKMGVRSPLDVKGAYVPSMGLGSIAVSPLDLASGYATLAAGGVHAEPMAIRKVVLANGKEDTQAGWGVPRRKRVLSDGVAATVTEILEDNMRYGTGTRAAIGRPAAGKTGTTDHHADAWFAGYTPDLQTTVWVGYTRGEVPMENVHGISVAGGTFPAEIWRRYMERAVAAMPERDFPEPRNPPVWQYFQRGPYALSYDPYAAPVEEEKQTETKPKRKRKPKRKPAAAAPQPGAASAANDPRLLEP
jgi:penicillin-binding protein 1A